MAPNSSAISHMKPYGKKGWVLPSWEWGWCAQHIYTRSPVGYSQCCCRTRWCRPHCQCRTKWVLRAAASVCRPQGISVWRCHPLGNRNDRSVTHTNGKLVQNLQYTRRTLIRHNRCQCSWSEQLAHLKKVQNCSVSCASINHLQTLNSP